MCLSGVDIQHWLLSELENKGGKNPGKGSTRRDPVRSKNVR